MKNTALYGNNIWAHGFNVTETILACQMACMYETKCKFWSYNKQAKRCAIKTSKGNAREGNNDQWESGAVNCVPNKPSKSSGPEPESEPERSGFVFKIETTLKPKSILQFTFDD